VQKGFRIRDAVQLQEIFRTSWIISGTFLCYVCALPRSIPRYLGAARDWSNQLGGKNAARCGMLPSAAERTGRNRMSHRNLATNFVDTSITKSSIHVVPRRAEARAGIFALALLIAAIVAVTLSAQPLAEESAARVVKYAPTYATVKFDFGPADPVARVRTGEILETDTLNCTKNCAGIPADKLELARNSNLLTGPFYIEGAEPGDALAIEFLELHVNGDEGAGEIAPGFGAINSTHYTPMLNPDLPRRSWAYAIHQESGTATYQAHDSSFSVQIPLHPFLGCVGVAPAFGETRSSLVPAEFGGNMDASESSVGNTLYLAVNVPGALVYVGDGHAAMGDGEIGGTAIEVPMHARLRFHVIKHSASDWPRWENQNELMAAGIYRPLDDSLRIAFTELVHWIHADYGLSEMDAYELLSKVATIHVAEMVDPNYVVVAKIDKKFLPLKKN
jgi:amidase